LVSTVTEVYCLVSTVGTLKCVVLHGLLRRAIHAASVRTRLRSAAILPLLPIAVGQVVRLPLKRWIERRSMLPSLVAESIVVLLALIGFSTAHRLLSAEPLVALEALGTVAVIHASMLVLATLAGYVLRLDGAGRIAFTLASSQKTVAAGVLVWQVGFPGNALGPVFVVLHHLLQTVADSVLAPLMPRIRMGKRRLFPLTS
jgi:predicted Na+-dependent transporter